MSYNLVILPEAQEDILTCALWYMENHDPSGNLTDAFLDAVEQTLERLKVSPTYLLYATMMFVEFMFGVMRPKASLVAFRMLFFIDFRSRRLW